MMWSYRHKCPSLAYNISQRSADFLNPLKFDAKMLFDGIDGYEKSYGRFFCGSIMCKILMWIW